MPTSTYTPIETFTASGSQLLITFNSFSGYTDLRLVIAGNTNNANVGVRFNGDTGTNYSRTVVRGYSTSTADSFRQSSQTQIMLDASVSQPGQNMFMDIFNYSNSTTYKTTLQRSNNATGGLDQGVGLWSSTAAITSIGVLMQAPTNYTAGTTFTLYGIKAA